MLSHCLLRSLSGEERTDLAPYLAEIEGFGPHLPPTLPRKRRRDLEFKRALLQLQKQALWMWDGVPASFPQGGGSQVKDPTKQARQGQSLDPPLLSWTWAKRPSSKGLQSGLDPLTPCGTGCR